MSDVTRLLSAIDAGDPKAAGELLPLVYAELRRLAAGVWTLARAWLLDRLNDPSS